MSSVILDSRHVHSSINGDMSVRAKVDTATMEWQRSPISKVWRKRIHLVGSAEAGQVTSLVRYEPGAEFPTHDHPNGEEILVLTGVFGDEHGEWPVGTHLLHPEGFSHAPFSSVGCELLVKLQQYSGLGRERRVTHTEEMEWQITAHEGIRTKILCADWNFPDETQLEEWDPGTSPGTWSYRDGAEILVLRGSFEDENGLYEQHSWLRIPAGGSHAPFSRIGCRLYVKTGGVSNLKTVAPKAND